MIKRCIRSLPALPVLATLIGLVPACGQDSQPAPATSTTDGETSNPSTTASDEASSQGAATGDSSDSPTSEGSSDASGTPSDSTTGETTAPKVCADYPEHKCTKAIDCSNGDCGPKKPISEEGCLRSLCKTDADCAEGDTCDFEASGSTLLCTDNAAGDCECISLDDIDGGYCVPR